MGNKLYCGLDFHKNVSELCVMDSESKVIDRVRLAAEKLITYLSNKPEYHIAIESSGGVFDITAKLEALGHKVTIINPSQFRGIGITGKKNDMRDAEALATALRLGFAPDVHKKTLYSRQMKSLLVSRDLVVRTRTSMTNHIRGIMREYGLPIPQGVTAFWEQISDRLQKIECEVIRGVLSDLVRQANAFKLEEEKIALALAEITKNDERVKRLETVPGVGPLTAVAFVATIDEVNRFKDAKHLASYLGLTPRENSSGGRVRHGSITKCGPELLRRYLVHGARATFRYAPKPENKNRCWAANIEKRAGTNKAIVAMAHKNARICYALMRDETFFGIKTTNKKLAA
jgi:transposase